MKFCFVGHTYHQKTRSTEFLIEVIRSVGEVDEYHSSPDESRFSDDGLIMTLARSRYDCYVFLQTEYIAEKLVHLDLGRFIIIPMYDGAIGRPLDYWKKFPDAQFISFSRTHHELLRAVECKSVHFRYFPPVPSEAPVRDVARRTAFFWERRPDLRLNLPLILDLAKRIDIESLHVHLAADFADKHQRDHAHIALMSEDIPITVSEWFETRRDFEACASGPLFYFAPRASEGIGMAVLEAIARGQIVISPDVPTMSEYIGHGVSGILYDLDQPEIGLDLSDEALATMSRAAYRKASFARTEWEEDIPKLMSILANDGRRWSTSDHSAGFVNRLRSAAQEKVWGELAGRADVPTATGSHSEGVGA